MGETPTVSLRLGNLQGAALVTVGGTLGYDGTLLGLPTNATSGGIVPVAEDLILTADSGFLDVQFLSLDSANAIDTAGVLASFDVTGLVPGDGVLSFDAFSLFAEDTEGNTLFDLTGGELPFVVLVPEPSAFGAILGLGACLRRRRR